MKAGKGKYLVALVLLASIGIGPGCTTGVGSGGAEETVTIYRDAYGVPHVLGDTPEALYYAGGYALMQDRMVEFERARRSALGRMAEFDAGFLEADKHSRLVALSETETKAMFDALSAEHQRMVRALVAGINKAIDEALADPENRMPYEFAVLREIEPERWTIHDYIVTYAAHRQSLASGAGQALQNLEFYRYLVGRYGEEQAQLIFDDVLPLDDPDAIPTNPSSGPFPESLSGIRVGMVTVSQRAAPPEPFAQTAFLGLDSDAIPEPISQLALAPALEPTHLSESRSLLIGPELSASGNVLMMQATSDGPHIRYLGAGFDAYGYTRQGGGPLVMGRGPTHGWLQNAAGDNQIDIFAEQLNPENRYQYRFNGEWHEMERRTETIQVRGGEPETIEVATTVHGPVMAWDLENDLAYSRQHALRGFEMNDWVCNLEWGRAWSLAEFEASIPLCSAGTTINYGDEDGTIAHWHAARRPIRPGGIDPRLPTPGTGEHEWQGFVPFSEWSKFKDPPAGYLFVWNNRTTPAITWGDDSRSGATHRSYIGFDLMEGRREITFEDFKELNRKLGRSFGGAGAVAGPKFWVPYLRPAVAGDARLEEAVERMAGWNAIFEDLDDDGYYDDVGLTITLRWLEVARKMILGGVLGEWESRPGGYATAVLYRVVQGEDAGLPVGFDWFRGQDRNAVLREAIAQVVGELTEELGTADMAEWKTPIFWQYYDAEALGQHPDKPSRRRTARQDEFSGWSGSTAAQLGIIPFAVPDNGSERWNGLMEIGPGVNRMYDASPIGGQNQFINLAGEATPNIGDQLMLHVNFEFKSVPMSPEELRAEARSVLTLEVPRFD